MGCQKDDREISGSPSNIQISDVHHSIGPHKR